MDINSINECMQSTLDYIAELEAIKEEQAKQIVELQAKINELTSSEDVTESTETIIESGVVCYFENNVENNSNKVLVWEDQVGNNEATVSYLDFVDGNASGKSGWTERGLQLNSQSNLDMNYVKAKSIQFCVNTLNWSLRKVALVIKAKTKSESEYLLNIFNWGYMNSYWYGEDETSSVSSYSLSEIGVLENNSDSYHAITLVFSSNNEISCYVDGVLAKTVLEKVVTDIEELKIYSSSIRYPELSYESVKFFEGELTAEEVMNKYEELKKKLTSNSDSEIITATVFSSVKELINSNLAVGSIVSTKGYYEENDGGSANYEILTKEDYFQQLPNDCKYIEILSGIKTENYGDGYGNHKLKNGLVAKLVIDNYITSPKQWGARGDGITSDTESFICMFALTKSGTIEFDKDSIYIIADRTENERSLYRDNRFCLSMVGNFTGGCQKPLIANCNNLILNGNGCTFKIPDDDFGQDSMGMICLGNVINGLEITGFTFDSNGLTMTDINKTSNHTIVYSPGTINAENSEISNVSIHDNKFLANGTIVDSKDGGGDHILIINPTISKNLFIENNEFYNWGRWVFSVDLGGNGERFYNYKFNGNKCIQNDDNKLLSGAYRGLGWIDFEAKKCWTGLEVCNNTVNGLIGFAMNGNGKVLEDFIFSNNYITRVSRSYRSAYPYFLNFYYVRTAKNSIMENNVLNQPYSATPSSYCLDNFIFRNNKVRSGGVLNINGIYGDIIIENNEVENNKRLVNITGAISNVNYKNAFPPYVDPDVEKKECNFIFKNNTGGIIGVYNGGGLMMNPSYPGLYNHLNIIIEGNTIKDLCLTNFDNEYVFDISKNTILNGATLVLRGAKFISPTFFDVINKPICGCAKYDINNIICKNVKMNRMELCPRIYTDFIKIGKVYDIYCDQAGYFPQMYTDAQLTDNQTLVKWNCYYTDNNLYMALNNGTTGVMDYLPTHTDGVVQWGDVKLLWLSNIGKIRVEEII